MSWSRYLPIMIYDVMQNVLIQDVLIVLGELPVILQQKYYEKAMMHIRFHSPCHGLVEKEVVGFS